VLPGGRVASRDRVEMPLEHEGASPAGTLACAHHDWAVCECGLFADMDDEGCDLLSRGFPLVNLEAALFHRCAGYRLNRAFVEGDGFGANQIHQEIDDVLLSVLD